MDPPRITQQTSTALPLHGELFRDAPAPPTLQDATFRGFLQWLFEGQGWRIMRPVLDFLLLVGATVAALGGPAAAVNAPATRVPLLALPLIVMLLFYVRGLYREQMRARVLDGIAPVVSAVSVASMTAATAGLLINGHAPGQRYWVRAWLFSLVAVTGARAVLTILQRRVRSRRVVAKPVLIVGAGVVGTQVARRLEGHPDYGLVPVGFLDEDPRSVSEVGECDVPVLGSFEDLEDTVQRTGVQHLIVAFSSVADARVSRIIQRSQELGLQVSVVPRMYDTINDRIRYETVGGLPLLSFSRVDPRGVQFAFKHLMDRLVAALLLVALSPLILAIYLAVRITSPGPALFRQRRVGRDGNLFDLYKFRSMRMAPASQARDLDERPPSALDFLLGGDTAPGGVEGEDRRTAVGRLLRRTSLDELPQLFNVLRGEMSLVGPRPERPEFVELFRQDIARYGDRHRVKAGITGWAQVHGLRGQTSLAERVEWDNYYIAHWSLGLDLKILALTFAAVFYDAE